MVSLKPEIILMQCFWEKNCHIAGYIEKYFLSGILKLSSRD